jgi:DNA-directed RNA polymerase specialized sigma24 family protein
LKEIAKDMGWTEATAKNNKYRCMEKLRSMINK